MATSFASVLSEQTHLLWIIVNAKPSLVCLSYECDIKNTIGSIVECVCAVTFMDCVAQALTYQVMKQRVCTLAI